MRHRLNEYTIVGNTIELYTDVTIEDIRLIVNETQGVVICSSMQKNNIDSVTTRDTGFSTLTIPTSVCELVEGDKLTIEIDKGDSIDTIKGDNQEATNTAIYNAVKSLPDLSLLYAARAEKNNDGENTYSIILPVSAKAIIDNNGVATIQL